MATDIFFQTLQRITGGGISLLDLMNVATALQSDGQGESAEQLYRVWLACNPGHPTAFVAHFNLSTLLSRPDQADAAIASLVAAIAGSGDFWPAHIHLVSALERKGDVNGAVAQWRVITDRLDQVTGAQVGYKLTAFKQIARVLLDHQQVAVAEANLALALDIDATQRDVLEQYIGVRLQQCHWPMLEPTERVSRETLMEGVSPLSMAVYTDDPILQLAGAARYVELMTSGVGVSPQADRRHATIETDRRIRIGYVSSDLRDHAVGFLMAELFEVHDKAGFELFAYYCGPPDPTGPTADRFKAAADHWTDLNGLSDEDAARKIAADGVDILVDINGHTRFARIGIFARRPAPIIVNWLGFPGAAGSPFHHYLIADDWIVPPGSEIYYSEKVLRLPCYQPNDRKRVVADHQPTRAEYGLPEGAFVFCCFNGSQKIGRFTFERWLEILRRTPGSVLWLLSNDDATNARLTDFAAQHGIEKERLVFAPKLVNALHLARYALADLFLDTFPYGAHTTASDALWMGVPVLTLSGRGFASRVCGSLVRSAGLEGLICDTPEAFVERAVALAADPAEIAAYKAQLAAGRESCTLFDMDRLARRLEGLYREMAADHHRGKLPRPDLTNLEAYFRVGIEHDPDKGEMLAVSDYHGHYRDRLALRHLARPLPPDRRLWSEADIARADSQPGASDAASIRLAVG